MNQACKNLNISSIDATTIPTPAAMLVDATCLTRSFEDRLCDVGTTLFTHW